jgi:O-antigen/teichoic acid export membrane protein
VVSIEVGTFITGSVRYLIARANVPWLGIAWPPRKMLSDFWRQALWLFLASLGYVMQNSSDLLIVGILLNPSAAAIYGTTGAVLRMAIEPLYAIISSANAGIAGLCGQQAWDRVERVRNEIHLMALVVITVLGVGVLSLNRAFMAWWIGPSYYAGDTLNVLLVLLALQSIPLRSDVMLMDGMLKFRERAISTIVANALGMGFAGVLAHFSGLEGAALGLFLGRVLAMTTYQIIIKQGSGIGVTGYFRWMGRPLLVGAGLLTVGYFSPFHLTNLISFFAVGAIVTLISSLIMWFLGLNAVQRSYLSQRFGSQLPKVTRYITSRG